MSYAVFAKSLQRAELGVTNAACAKAGDIILELEKQRDELLEALKRVLPIAEDGVEQYGGGADDHEDIVFARKAEANAEK